MPTKKRRVGFIPRSNVLEIINKLSYESNLSNSKIINILVEESLYKRGFLDKDKNTIILDIKSSRHSDFKKTSIDSVNLNLKEVSNDLFDSEIYEKFLLFLKFQEKMKKTNL